MPSRRVARDLDNLTLATGSLKRHEKVAKDAAERQPKHNQRWFAGRVLAVKVEYGLTFDPQQRDALGSHVGRMPHRACRTVLPTGAVLMSRQLDGQRRERDFHAATHALHWHRAEQLAVAALQDRDLTDAERDAWRERRAAARRGIARRG